MIPFRQILRENSEFYDTVKGGKPYLVIEVGSSIGWESTSMKPQPISQMVKGKEKLLAWAQKKYTKVHTVRGYYKRRGTHKVVFVWTKWDGWKSPKASWTLQGESALPAGFDGFDNMDVEPLGLPKVDLNKLPDTVQRDVVVKIGKFKWLVYRRPSDYTAWAYKHPSAKRKGYEIISVGKGNFEVWQTTGGGERMKKKPDATGKIK